MHKQFLNHVTTTLGVLIFKDKSVALNVGSTSDKLTGSVMEGNGRSLVWDNVPGIFLEGL
jgi:hypothetical protein